MTARQIRNQILTGTASIKSGWPAPPENLTVFQKKRHRRIKSVSRMYLIGGMGVDEIGASLGLSHQRVSAIVKNGIEILVRYGWLETPAQPQQSAASRKV